MNSLPPSVARSRSWAKACQRCTTPLHSLSCATWSRRAELHADSSAQRARQLSVASVFMGPPGPHLLSRRRPSRTFERSSPSRVAPQSRGSTRRRCSRLHPSSRTPDACHPPSVSSASQGLAAGRAAFRGRGSSPPRDEGCRFGATKAPVALSLNGTSTASNEAGVVMDSVVRGPQRQRVRWKTKSRSRSRIDLQPGTCPLRPVPSGRARTRPRCRRREPCPSA